MGLMPKFKVGEYVVDSETVGGSESIVLIEGRRPCLENYKADWIYFGREFEVSGSPISLRYKTTINTRESKLQPLSSRISGP